MARTFADATEGMANRALQFRQLRNQQETDQLQKAKTLADLKESGYSVSQQPRSFFGGGGLSITKDAETAAPRGFVKLPGGKYEKDPSFLNPLQESRKKLNEANANSQSILGGVTTDVNGDAVQAKKTPEEILASLPEHTRGLVKGITDYSIDPTKTASMYKGNQRQQLIELAKQIDPTYDMTQFPARSKYRQEFSSGKIGGNIRSYNTALQHLAELNSATNEVPSNPIQPIEGAQRSFARDFQGNSPTALGMTKEDTALTAVSGELANIFKNSGGTDQEIDKWFKSYNPNAPREAKQQFIKTGIQLMQGRMNAVGSDYERVMGKSAGKLISPEAETALGQINGGGDQGSSPSEEDIQFTMAQNKMTREQVLQALKG